MLKDQNLRTEFTVHLLSHLADKFYFLWHQVICFCSHGYNHELNSPIKVCLKLSVKLQLQSGRERGMKKKNDINQTDTGPIPAVHGYPNFK